MGFAAMLFALSALAPTTILCVGSGGHLAIEAQLARCCDPAVPHHPAGESVADGQRCADDCTDTPLGIYAVYRSPDQAIPALHVLAPTTSLLFAAPSPSLLPGRLVRRPLNSLPPRALRTTIHLC